MLEQSPDEMKRYQAMTNLLMQPNSRTIGVIKLIDKYYPALAKKVTEGNPIMERFVTSGFNTMDILMFPVCGHCESLAAFSGGAELKRGRYVPVCTCYKCGKSTVDPVLMKQWCMEEIKKKAPETIGEDLMAVVDLIADKMVEKAKDDLKRAMLAEKRINKSK